MTVDSCENTSLNKRSSCRFYFVDGFLKQRKLILNNCDLYNYNLSSEVLSCKAFHSIDYFFLHQVNNDLV